MVMVPPGVIPKTIPLVFIPPPPVVPYRLPSLAWISDAVGPAWPKEWRVWKTGAAFVMLATARDSAASVKVTPSLFSIRRHAKEKPKALAGLPDFSLTKFLSSVAVLSLVSDAAVPPSPASASVRLAASLIRGNSCAYHFQGTPASFIRMPSILWPAQTSLLYGEEWLNGMAQNRGCQGECRG